MLDSGYKYTSRQWVLISFLGLLIGVSLIFIFSYSDLTNQLVLLASGKQINYLETVDFPDINELNGLFPEEGTDNVEVSFDIKAVITTPAATLTPTISPSLSPTSRPAVPAPTKITTSTPIPTVVVTTTVPTTIVVRDYSVPWPVSPGCSSSWLNCVPCTSGDDCRYEPGETHGFRGWACQNNNPGNIRPSDFRNSLIVAMGGTASCGIRYDSRGGSYMVFTDYTTGFNSLKAYLKAINAGMHSSYTNCGDCTLRFFAETYSYNFTTYANGVGAYLNVNPDTTTLRSLVETRLDDLAYAIKHQEGFITQ